MILPNLRQRLTTDDRQLVLDVLAEGDAGRRWELERRAGTEGPDALLDAPELPRLLRDHPGCAVPSAQLFIYVTVRHTLRDTGIEDVRLADYLGALLHDFGARNRAWRIAPHDDDEYHTLTDILASAVAADGRRGFLLRVHLGNYSLWLAGVFPDRITARRERRGGPGFRYYEELGAQGFRLAADDRYARELEVADVYTRAADLFASLRVALNRLSDQAFFRNIASADRLLRQVRDDNRFPPRAPSLF